MIIISKKQVKELIIPTISKKDLPVVGRDVLLVMAEELIDLREAASSTVAVVGGAVGGGKSHLMRMLTLEHQIVNAMLASSDDQIPETIIGIVIELRKLRLQK